MKKIVYGAIALVGLVTCAQPAKPTENSFDRTMTSTIKMSSDKYGQIVSTLNRRFKTIGYVSEIEGPMLLVEEFNSRKHLNLEGQEGQIKTESWIGSNFSKKHWTINHEGDECLFNDDGYVVRKYGCCASFDTDIYFNLSNGVRLFSVTSPIFKVSIPNTGDEFTRYIAYHSANGSWLPSNLDKDSTFIGIIHFASPESPINQITIHKNNIRFYDLSLEPEVNLFYKGKQVKSSQLEVWDSNRFKNLNALSDLRIVLHFDKVSEIIIPIKNGLIDQSKITIPPDF